MAKKNTGPRPFELRRLEALPQRFDVWQVGARQVEALIEADGLSVRPWVVLVASASEGLILASELSLIEPGLSEGWSALAKAMASPAAGEAHLPTTIQFADENWAQTLRPSLEVLNIDDEIADLEQLDEMLTELTSNLGEGNPDVGLLETEGVTPDLVSAFFDAAAVFYEQAPWKKVGERAIKIDSDRFEGGPWFGVMMGQAGMTAGLVLYDDYETLERIREDDTSSQEKAAITAALAVVFGTKDEVPPADLEAARQHGWRIAGARAYPAVYRMDPGMVMRAPEVWELELLEGCLRAVPEFVRKKTRRLGPTAMTVPGAGGDVPLVLSWAEE
jgi:hypothetical protein